MQCKRHMAAIAVVIAIGFAASGRKAVVEAAEVRAPRFEVDPTWPKPLPNHWVVGEVDGVSVDANDHVWIIHGGTNGPGAISPTLALAAATPPAASCCIPAPPVLEFDQAGNLLSHWGGPAPDYQWPGNHGILADGKGNVWISGSGLGKFSVDGKLLFQIGKPGERKGSNDTESVGRPAKVFFDKKANELYVSDGYVNKRVLVLDADTGKYKRHWGAYGSKPDDTNAGPYNPDAPAPQQFRNPVHCAELSNDGLVYVCDRKNDRLQVFKPDGTFVKEKFFFKQTLDAGSVFDVAFSKDPQQKYMYLADGANEKIYIMVRDTLEILTSFGDGGRQPGQFFTVHGLATDSKGNLFTGEVGGQRVQKFVYQGLAPVTTPDQGVVWPKGKK